MAQANSNAIVEGDVRDFMIARSNSEWKGIQSKMGQKKATSLFCYMQTTSCKIGQSSKLGNNNKRSNQWGISPSSREMNPMRVPLLFARVDLNVHYISDLKH